MDDFPEMLHFNTYILDNMNTANKHNNKYIVDLSLPINGFVQIATKRIQIYNDLQIQNFVMICLNGCPFS